MGSQNEHEKGKKFRNLAIGSEKVPETVEYDHVDLFNNYSPRINDRLSKGRRAFHSVSGSGIRKKSIIILIVTYGSET